MIPKIIHYCWFGKGVMPGSQREYIRGWQKIMPDYQIICWNETNFPIEEFPYAQEAYKLKKWAFVSDVARIYALNKMGGIYLDTDVEVLKPLDRFLNESAFSGVEMYADEFEKEGRQYVNGDGTPKKKETMIPMCGFLSAIIGAEKGNPFIKEVLEIYKQRNPYNEKGEFNQVVIDGLLAMVAAKEDGFRYVDCYQRCKRIVLYPSSVFAYVGVSHLRENYIYHYTAWSWMPKSRKQKFFLILDKIGILQPYRRLKKNIKAILK